MPYFTTHDVVYKDHEHVSTTVTASASVVDEWITDTLNVYRRKLSKLVIGLDTEWCLPAYPGPYQKSAVLQLCVGRRCLVYQIYYARYFPNSLVDFLGDEQFTFVGKGVGNEKDKLSRDYGLAVGNCKDVGDWTASMCKGQGRQKAVRTLSIIAASTLSKWNVEKLSDEQIEYACLDAFVSFRIGEFLSNIGAESNSNFCVWLDIRRINL